MHHLNLKVGNSDYAQKLEAKLSKLKNAEEKTSARVKKLENEMWDEIENMKSEYRAGKFLLPRTKRMIPFHKRLIQTLYWPAH